MSKSSLPSAFVYLSAIAPGIVQSPRYATPFNIAGVPLNGYVKPLIIITDVAAAALKQVQETVQHDGFNLVVYDAYRPQCAVEQLKEWANDDTHTTKKWYYPRIQTKQDLFTYHFIAPQSSHSRGSTVDVTLIAANQQLHTPYEKEIILSDGNHLIALDDGTIDMGTSFDFMDEASRSRSPLITQSQQTMRSYLADAMNQAGFKGCVNEWWHFELKDEPFPATYFNFPIK